MHDDAHASPLFLQRAILRRHMEESGESPDEIAHGPHRDALAAELLMSWPSPARTEAITETGYFEAALVHDLASALQGGPGAVTPHELGQRLMQAASAYIVTASVEEAERVAEDMRLLDTEAARDAAAIARAEARETWDRVAEVMGGMK